MPRDETLRDRSVTATERALAQDRAAIIEVIRAETQAFVDLDFEAWSACWLHAERTQSVSVSPSTGLTTIRGWDKIARDMKRVIDGGYGCDMVRFRQENHQVTIEGDMAWVVFDGWAENGDGRSWTTFETRILERENGAWAFAYNAFMLERDPGETRHQIAVDDVGRIVGASPESLARLKDHPSLTVSAGRIRARRLDWDKVLQREIKRAGQYHGYFELYRFAAETGGPFQFPVVLGETDAGGLALATISVRNCITYLQIDGDAQLGRRLQLASAVFGLSEGQARLAALIAAGDGLKVAAERLGISINTARTHLTRLYEKTGVNSQTALVRLLLSVG